MEVVTLKYTHENPIMVRIEDGKEKVEIEKGDTIEVNTRRASNLSRMYGDRFKEVPSKNSKKEQKKQKSNKQDICECGAKPGETCKENCPVGKEDMADDVETQDIKKENVKKA